MSHSPAFTPYEAEQLDDRGWALVLAESWERVRDEPPGYGRLGLVEQGIRLARTYRSYRARHLNEGAGT